MYRNFVEVTVVEVFDDKDGFTKFAGVIKIGEREVWRGSLKNRLDMEGAYTQAEAKLAHVLGKLLDQPYDG